jgi:uncharacterized membrane protein
MSHCALHCMRAAVALAVLGCGPQRACIVGAVGVAVVTVCTVVPPCSTLLLALCLVESSVQFAGCRSRCTADNKRVCLAVVAGD